MSAAARNAVGRLLRRLQEGESLGMPRSRPMPSIGAQIHELRVNDESQTWRVIYRVDAEEIVVAEIFSKKVQQTPSAVIATCKARYVRYDEK